MTPLAGTKIEDFERILKINLTAVFATVQAAAPHLNDHASIVLNGSVHSAIGSPGFAAYAATKAGVVAMARVFASELAERGIRVNVVSPGATRTPIWDGLATTPAAMSALETRIARGIPLARFGEPEEIAKTVAFLASSDASNITAVEIFVDGGSVGAKMGAPAFRVG
jgi:NAD(P)-dependent dehydrogenase (short-subunit alcohol dehydrogenase family)